MQSDIRKAISIRSTLMIYALTLSALPILVVGAIGLYVLITSMQQEILTNNLLLSRSLENEVETFLEQPVNLLKQVAEIIIRPGLIAAGKQTVYLEKLIKNYSFMDLVMIVGKDGRVYAHAPYNPNIDGIDMSGKDFFQKSRFEKKPYWSPTFIPPHTDQPTISISIPFKDGIIAGYLDLSALGDIIDKFNTGTDRSALIVDKQGTVIAHPDRSLVTQRWNLSHYGNVGKGLAGTEEGVFPYEVNGTSHLGSVAVIQGVKWIIHISQPLTVAYAPVHRIGIVMAVGMGLAIFMAIVISIPIMRKILSPLIRLTEQSGRIAQGDYDLVKGGNGFRETLELSNSFNLMVTAVRKREDQLRQSEAEILKHTAMLESTNTELTAAKETAEAANRAKTTFLANMSHELRTPLNAILGFTQMMQQDNSLSTTVQEEIGIVNSCGRHLLALINDVLEIVKIEAGRIVATPTNFDLHWFLQSISEIFASSSTAHELKFVLKKAPDLVRHIQADEGKLRQVLINLLGNAHKFTRTGQIELRVMHGNLNERTLVRFEIEDTGIGIASEDLETIFDPFVQSRPDKSNGEIITGTGLGLTISRQYILLMGGEISVESTPGKGTVFVFSIPVKQVRAADVAIRQSRRQVIALAPNQPVFRILIVEDQDENRFLLRKLLTNMGFKVREAANGLEGVEIFSSWEPDLVWMDMRMPVMDGYEATKQIKTTEKGAQTPVIALSAHAFEEERNEILAAGCDDFVGKPFHMNDIFDVMARHLGVQYIYEENQQPSTPPSEALLANRGTDVLPKLPEALVMAAKEALVAIDTDKIRQVIEDISKLDDALGQTLSRLADDFQFQRILSMIDSAGRNLT